MTFEEAGSRRVFPLPGEHLSHTLTGYPWRFASLRAVSSTSWKPSISASVSPAESIIDSDSEAVKFCILIHCLRGGARVVVSCENG